MNWSRGISHLGETMKSIEEFQVYLLSQMRAEPQVKRALESLGIHEEAVPSLRQHMEERFSPGHGLAQYKEVLGKPNSESEGEADEYRARVARWVLPLWPGFCFCVYSSHDGIVGDMRFERHGRAPQIIKTCAEWEPWTISESEALTVRPDLTKAEEWPPMSDHIRLWSFSRG